MEFYYLWYLNVHNRQSVISVKFMEDKSIMFVRIVYFTLTKVCDQFVVPGDMRNYWFVKIQFFSYGN